MRWRTWLLPLFVASLIAAGCGGDDDDDGGATAAGDTTETTAGDSGGSGPSEVVKIGAIYEQTGDLQQLGTAAISGAQIAVDEINEAGGFEIDGTQYTLELVSRDTRSDPTVAAAATTELTRDEEIKFIFGTASSSGVLSMLPIETQAGAIGFAACGACAAKGLMGTDETAYFFKTYANEWFKYATFVEAIKRYLPDAKRVGLMDRDINKAATDAIKPALEAAGYEVPEPIYYPPGTTDFSPFLSRVKDADVDVLFVGLSDTDVEAVARQGVEQQAMPAILTTLNSMSIAQDPPLSIPYLVTYSQPQLVEPSNQKRADFVEEHFGDGVPPQVDYMLYSYDYVYMLVEAMKEAGSVDDTDAIRDSLEGLEYEGLVGPISFDENHEVVVGADIGVVENGEVTIEELSPEQLEETASTLR